MERHLADYILKAESVLYGITNEDARSLAYQLAVRNGITNNFNISTKKAGKNWLLGFRKRFPEITLRTPEATSGT